MTTEFLVLFREPDGRLEPHPVDFTQLHQQHWKAWLTQYTQLGNVVGGQSLTLQGAVLKQPHEPAQAGPYQVRTEIVGGYLLLKAGNLDEAIAILRSCPIFDAGGYAEIREIMRAGRSSPTQLS